jgi:signal transduction histidine kinase
VTSRDERRGDGVARFRAKLLVALMLVISAATITALYVGQRSTARTAEADLRRKFDRELAGLHNAQQLRHAALVERCRALVRRPRIHAALEDDALDLLYPSARDELRDLMMDRAVGDEGGYALHAEFYRFLGPGGVVIPPGDGAAAGALPPRLEQQLALPTLPAGTQLGYAADGARLYEVLATPIISSETGEPIAALVLGFRPASFGADADASGIRRGVWLGGQLRLAGLPASDLERLQARLPAVIAAERRQPSATEVTIGGAPHLLLTTWLNPASAFPPAHEIYLHPLTELQATQRQLRRQVLTVAALLLLGGFGASRVLAVRLARPVERLALASAADRAERVRAEAALEQTSEELQRAARFSADASHQLKTPVTVLRAGLEELLTHENLTVEQRHELSALVHQTYRLSGVIEDLLLLSRLDAGRLAIEFAPVDLSYLIETALDDLGARSDGQELLIETNVPAGLMIAGDRRYLPLVLQNLLENARKYNQPGGRIQIGAREQDGTVCFRVGNTGRPIPPAAQLRIFERFHRGSMGENVPGYGLGLNLARELARLHGGELRLLRSDEDWTEFEVQFPAAVSPAARRSG